MKNGTLGWKIVGLLAAASVLLMPAIAGSTVGDKLVAQRKPAPVQRTAAHAAAVRTPQPVPGTALEAAWQAAIAGSPVLQRATISAYAYDLTANRPLGAINPQQLQIPASVTKMFTSAAALAALGPNFTYTTRVEAAPSVLSGQGGPIYLVGGGDPWLEANGTHGLEQLAAAVARQIHSATAVIGVGTLFAPPAIGAGWSLSELQDDFSAGANALSAERSEVEVIVSAGAAPGDPVRISLSFNGAVRDPGYFTIRNQATTVAAGATGAAISRLPGTNIILVQGSMRPGTSTGTYLSVHDAALYAASLFQQALAQRGVHFSAPPATGTVPANLRTVASVNSPVLSHLLQIQNRFSINVMADNLYRLLGALHGGSGSAAAAQAAMNGFDARAGFGGEPAQVDGSGLSPLNLRSALDVVSMLRYAARQPWYAAFKASMMEAGNPNPKVCGVICGHFVGTAAQDRVWLKTGNLENQWNYAGYATAANGHTIAFAILVEGPLTQQLDGIGGPIDQMTVELARWPNLPSGRVVPQQQAKAPPFVAAILQSLPALQGAVLGGEVVNARTGQVVWQQDGGTLIRSAWVPRLALLAGALASGPQQFGEIALRAGGPVQGGIVQGPLILDGADNPAISAESFTQLAQALQSAGITSIAGPIEYVQGPVASLGANRWPEGAVWESVGQAYLPPASRLIAQGGVVTLTVSAAAAGAPATVQVSPADAPIAISDQAVGSSAGQPTVSAQLVRGTDRYVVTGDVPVGNPVTLEVAPPNPGLLAATELRDALTRSSIQIADPAVQAVAPGTGGAVLAALPGSTVASIAPVLLRDPSSETASQLGLLLGSSAAKDITAAVGPVDIIPDPTGIAMNDYMTPQSVASLLVQAEAQSPAAALSQALGIGLWRVTAPGTEDTVGYVRGPDCTLDAAVFLQSGLPFSGQFTLSIKAPSP